MSILTQFVGAASIGTIVYLYVTNNVFRYYIKHTIFAVALTTCATIFVPLMLWRPKSYKNAILPAWTLKRAGQCLGIKCTLQGQENLVKNSASIVLINHQSIIDMLILAELWPILDECTVIAKKEIFYMWPFGLATWLWGTIFIDRLNGEKAKETINETAKTITRRKAKLCMFPEGTRHGGSDLLPFKKGAFYVGISSQCPLQPIIASQYYFLDSKKHIFDKGTISIKILPPIPTTGLEREDIDSLMATTYDIMNREYKDITRKNLDSVKSNTAS